VFGCQGLQFEPIRRAARWDMAGVRGGQAVGARPGGFAGALLVPASEEVRTYGPAAGRGDAGPPTTANGVQFRNFA